MNPLVWTRRPAGGSGNASFEGPRQTMGIPPASTTSRPCRLGPHRQAGHVPAAVGQRRVGPAIAHLTGLSRDAISDIRRRWGKRKLARWPSDPARGDRRGCSEAYRRELRRAADWPAGPGVRLHRLEHRPPGHIPAPAHRHWPEYGLAAAAGACRAVRHRPAQAHPERQTRRARVPAGQKASGEAKKGRSKRTRPMNCGMPMPASLSSCPTWSAAG